MLRILVLLSAFLAADSSTRLAQGKQPAQVMVLGSYHFANPGLDIAKFEVADVLAEEKQAEILEIVDALALFEPTKIAIEADPRQAVQFERRYQNYREGNHELTRNERQQLGFRLADLCDHEKLYPIDHSGNFPMQEVMAYAQEKDPEFVKFYEDSIKQIETEANEWQRTLSIGEILRRENSPERIAGGHDLYLKTARVGAGDDPVGARLVTAWYERNIHIFANLAAIAEPGERILVIMGAGHLGTLKELIQGSSEMTWVSALDYL
ncbi:MAG: DUF5694 domain-containing protein [Planctomycetota bacterium]|jgi:hypothetical protein